MTAVSTPTASIDAAPPHRRALPPELQADLRTDHAGETGAVWIYRGVLAVSRDAGVRDFAQRHQATERMHLARIEAWLAPAGRSRVLPLWRAFGWLTGALPALAGPAAVYATIAVVEHFVDRHYQTQIDRLAAAPAWAALRDALENCRRDEVAHRDEAAALGPAAAGPLLRGWCALVDTGSTLAVRVSRHV